MAGLLNVSREQVLNLPKQTFSTLGMSNTATRGTPNTLQALRVLTCTVKGA